MLVLSRKKNQTVVLTIGGERVVVTVNELRGDTVRLGFEAAQDVRILRGELEGLRGGDDQPPECLQL